MIYKKFNIIFYLIFLFLSIFLNQSFGQQIAPQLGGTCEILNESSVCYPYLNYTHFYLPPNVTFQSVNKIASDNLGLLQLTTIDCKSNATYIFCIQQFPKCNILNESLSDNSTVTFFLPSLPCNSICLLAEKPCKSYIDKYFPSLTCNSNYTNGQEIFPKNFTKYILNEKNEIFNVSIECVNSNELINDQGNNEIQCPTPLLNAKDYVIPGKNLYYYVTDNCIIDCPFEIYPTYKMKLLDTAQWVLTIISFICTTFMILTFGVLPNKITHRMESILSFACGAWLTCLCLFVQSSEDNFNCSHDRGRYKSQSDNLCLFTGLFLFQFGAITTILWGPVITFDFYLTSKMKKFKHFGRIRIVMWSTLIILSALPGFGGKYGSTVATSGCWIISDNGGVWQYISFYIPSWISLGLMTLFSILSVINISKMYQQTPNKMILFFNIKIIITIIILLFNLTFASSLKFYLESKMDMFFDSVYQWAHCISTTTGNDKSNCILDPPGYDLKALNVVVVSTLGIAVFIGFIDPIVLDIWRNSTKLKWVINKIGLNKYINLSTSSSSSSNTNSNNNRKSGGHGSKKIRLSTIENYNNTENTNNTPGETPGNGEA